MSHYDMADVLKAARRPEPGYPRVAHIVLDADDTADNPASTKRRIHGPAVVTYALWPDGGIDGKVRARLDRPENLGELPGAAAG